MSELTGAGGTTMLALSTIGSDLSVSISLQTASELVEAAHEAGLNEDELVGVVIGIAVILSALQAFIARASRVRKEAALAASAKLIDAVATERRLFGEARNEFVSELMAVEKRRAAENSALDFAHLFVSIGARISFSISIQLLASSARARQSSRGARILSLLGLVAFFAFVESNARRSLF
jgi:hypothetical protein